MWEPERIRAEPVAGGGNGAADRPRRRSTRRGAARVLDVVQRLLPHDPDAGGLAGFARVLAERELAEISRWSPHRLATAAEIAYPLAARIAAAFELGRTVERSRARKRASVAGPADVHGLLAPRIRGREQELFFVLLLDGRHRLRQARLVSVGTLGASLVHPREVFGLAVREAAAAILVAHSHPSGDPAPSAEDVEVTRRLIASAALLGIPLLDHVIVTDAGWYSLRSGRPDLDFGPHARGSPGAAPPGGPSA